MVNNSVYDIVELWMVMVGEASAVIATQTRKDERGFELALDWKTVSIAHMLELSDLNPSKARGRKCSLLSSKQFQQRSDRLERAIQNLRTGHGQSQIGLAGGGVALHE